MPRTLIECRALIHRQIQELQNAGRSGKILGVSFLLCEDEKTVMVYVDLDDENDAIAIWFDLKPGEIFGPQRYRRDFFKRLTVVS
ncbi:hypothetical protein [Bradyrhizobium sp. JYMT SZCCT0428]|uniref:hypothetical protein n=1 Tax=Bradyrhizobium sp. JYMT SZCCT0428 TaxID=2807673 RepID=UPI001BAB885D|nr:hypothetical protein [Bradyrhizobium sp. JYMT SZCCT0428]MBR1151926.1 hypothetical protein [Bradyrhizobium sp. JYMT SZCCT0428]